MAARSRLSWPGGPSPRLAPSRFGHPSPSSKGAAEPVRKTPCQGRPAGASQPEPASRQDLELRLVGRRLGHLRGDMLRITCGCGHSGDVPVSALVDRHGEEARVQDSIALMRCSACGARRIRAVSRLD